MIEGFEKQTKDLTDYEKRVLLPLMIKGLSHHVGAENAITNSEICMKLSAKGYDNINEVRVRKIINYIRNNNLVPRLMATYKGYYVTNDPAELYSYISSLSSRIAAISQIRDAMIQNYENLKMYGS
jgi:hypothetical protein